MAKSYIQKIEEEINSLILEEGFDLEYVENINENGRNVVRIVIDKKEESISADDCEIISRKIEDIVDKIMKDKEYVLEVSSAGLEKALKNIKLYKKYIGKKAFVRLYKKTKLTEKINEKEFEADIVGVDEENENVTFKIESEKFTLNINDIASANTVFDFDAFFKNNDNK